MADKGDKLPPPGPTGSETDDIDDLEPKNQTTDPVDEPDPNITEQAGISVRNFTIDPENGTVSKKDENWRADMDETPIEKRQRTVDRIKQGFEEGN